MHSLRHSWVAAMATGGLAATTLARLAGHSDAGFTAPGLRIRPARRRRGRPESRCGGGLRWLVRFLVRFRCRLLAPRVREPSGEGRSGAVFAVPVGCCRLAPRPLQAGGRKFEPCTAHRSITPVPAQAQRSRLGRCRLLRAVAACASHDLKLARLSEPALRESTARAACSWRTLTDESIKFHLTNFGDLNVGGRLLRRSRPPRREKPGGRAWGCVPCATTRVRRRLGKVP